MLHQLARCDVLRYSAVGHMFNYLSVTIAPTYVFKLVSVFSCEWCPYHFPDAFIMSKQFQTYITWTENKNKVHQSVKRQIWLLNTNLKSGCVWVNSKQDDMFTVTSEGHKGHNLHQAREKEIQYHCVYHSRILMSDVNVLQLNHIQRQSLWDEC